jgi:hypothetical protein
MRPFVGCLVESPRYLAGFVRTLQLRHRSGQFGQLRSIAQPRSYSLLPPGVKAHGEHGRCDGSRDWQVDHLHRSASQARQVVEADEGWTCAHLRAGGRHKGRDEVKVCLKDRMISSDPLDLVHH